MAIDDSFNVTAVSCVDNGPGDYTIAWTTAFTSTNYAVAGLASACDAVISGAPAAGSVRILTLHQDAGTATDVDPLCVIAIGDQ